MTTTESPKQVTCAARKYLKLDNWQIVEIAREIAGVDGGKFARDQEVEAGFPNWAPRVKRSHGTSEQ